MVQLDRDLEKKFTNKFQFFLLEFILHTDYINPAKNQAGQLMGSRENASFVTSPWGHSMSNGPILTKCVP